MAILYYTGTLFSFNNQCCGYYNYGFTPQYVQKYSLTCDTANSPMTDCLVVLVQQWFLPAFLSASIYHTESLVLFHSVIYKV